MVVSATGQGMQGLLIIAGKVSVGRVWLMTPDGEQATH